MKVHLTSNPYLLGGEEDWVNGCGDATAITAKVPSQDHNLRPIIPFRPYATQTNKRKVPKNNSDIQKEDPNAAKIRSGVGSNHRPHGNLKRDFRLDIQL